MSSEQTKHTPGPWEYEQATKTIRAKPSNYWLATIDSFEGAVDHDANAHLMALSPELLQACLLIADTDKPGIGSDERYDLIVSAQKAAQSAIAKIMPEVSEEEIYQSQIEAAITKAGAAK